MRFNAVFSHRYSLHQFSTPSVSLRRRDQSPRSDPAQCRRQGLNYNPVVLETVRPASGSTGSSGAGRQEATTRPFNTSQQLAGLEGSLPAPSCLRRCPSRPSRYSLQWTPPRDPSFNSIGGQCVRSPLTRFRHKITGAETPQQEETLAHPKLTSFSPPTDNRQGPRLLCACIPRGCVQSIQVSCHHCRFPIVGAEAKPRVLSRFRRQKAQFPFPPFHRAHRPLRHALPNCRPVSHRAHHPQRLEVQPPAVLGSPGIGKDPAVRLQHG